MRTVIFFILMALALPVRAAGIRITVLHTNDIHGWILPRLPYFDPSETKRLIGGAEAFAAYAKKVRGPKLLLDAGDWYQGTPEGSLRGGRVMADFFNTAGYDALAVGNHEYDNGEANLQNIIKALKAPVMAANVYRQDGRRAPDFRPWIIKKVGGIKVGLFGLTHPNLKNLAFPDDVAGLDFRDGIDDAREAVAALRKRGATVIIAVTHQGIETPGAIPFRGDRFLARSVSGIDLIIGGHSHTLLASGEREPDAEALIVQAGSELVRAGEVVLEVDPRTKRLVHASARLVDLWVDETGKDPDMARVMAGISREVGSSYDAVIGTAAAAFGRDSNRESSMGDWVTDCMREWAGVDLALQNGGGIRGDFPVGAVTLRHIYNVMPYENRMVKLVMRGRGIWDALDRGMGTVRIAQVSGATLTFRRPAPSGQRIGSVSIAGRPLVEDSTYTVVTTDFLVQGGDGHSAFKSAVNTEFTHTRLRDVLQGCVEKRPLLTVPPAGRMVPLGG